MQFCCPSGGLVILYIIVRYDPRNVRYDIILSDRSLGHCYVRWASRRNNVEAFMSWSSGERRRKNWAHNFKGSTILFKYNIFEPLRTGKGEVLVYGIQKVTFFFFLFNTN